MARTTQLCGDGAQGFMALPRASWWGDYAGDQVYKVRAYTYLNGVSVAQAQMSSAMQQSFGEHAAQFIGAGFRGI